MTVDPANVAIGCFSHDEDPTEANTYKQDNRLSSAYQTPWPSVRLSIGIKTCLLVLIATCFRTTLSVSIATTAQSPYTCSFEPNQGVKCWGLNSGRQLGIGSNVTSLGSASNQMGANLAIIDTGINVADIIGVETGQGHTCVLATIAGTNRTKCWGSNGFGQLGYGDTIQRGGTPDSMGDNLPFVNVGPNYVIRQIAPGGAHTCALLYNTMLTRNEIICWGMNNYGQLGYGDTMDRWDPLSLLGIDVGFEPVEVIVGDYVSCALSPINTVKCWGQNTWAQLGLGDTSNRGDGANEMGAWLLSIDLGFGFDVWQVAVGAQHSCALSTTGSVKCWGMNNYGQLGIGNTLSKGHYVGEMGSSLPPVVLGSSFNPVKIVVQSYSSCALSDANAVKCWGKNNKGQLGYGDVQRRGDDAGEMGDNLATVDLGSLFYTEDMQAGHSHVCAISTSDEVKCWGVNTFGELGLENANNRGDAPGEMSDFLPIVDLGYSTTDPSISPTEIPTINPSNNPTNSPSKNPTNNPSTPTSNPTSPSTPPSISPTVFPSRNPLTTGQTAEPAQSPTRAPTISHSNNPTSPSTPPSINPTFHPSRNPLRTGQTAEPTQSPTRAPTTSHSNNPTSPSTPPSISPTAISTLNPSSNPTTSPSNNPSKSPSKSPTMSPSKITTISTLNPSAFPTIAPSAYPTTPTNRPIKDPTRSPFANPTISPSNDPTAVPTIRPTQNPLGTGKTAHPTQFPTVTPSNNPTDNPSITPSNDPTKFPSNNPTVTPSNDPTAGPTTRPTRNPLRTGQTAEPTQSPTRGPTTSPTPTYSPTASPIRSPTVSPTSFPTRPGETRSPTLSPTPPPSTAPTAWRECIDKEIELSGIGSIQILIAISAASKEIEIKLAAPKSVWFGIGFGGNTMNRTTLALTVSMVNGMMRLSPRRLHDHAKGVKLSDALDSIDTTEIGDIRAVTLVKPWTMDGLFDFSDFLSGEQCELPIIWAVGSDKNFAGHDPNYRGSVTLRSCACPTSDPTSAPTKMPTTVPTGSPIATTDDSFEDVNEDGAYYVQLSFGTMLLAACCALFSF